MFANLIAMDLSSVFPAAYYDDVDVVCDSPFVTLHSLVQETLTSPIIWVLFIETIFVHCHENKNYLLLACGYNALS